MADTPNRLEVFPPIHRCGAAGRWVRSMLQAEILRGTHVLVRIQGLRSPWRNTVMQASSFLGEEEFYMLIVGLVVWICDAKLGRLMVLLMATCFYITGFLKNLLCLPRPPSPPVVPLQRCQDWSLPSHHAVLNVNIPWYIWFYIDLNYTLPPPVKLAVFVLITVWSFSVMFSRMYLGVHSPADILTGGVIGCILLALWLQCHERVDVFLSNSPSLLSLVGVVCIVMLLLSVHPDPYPVTIIFAETVCMTGVAMGFVIGQVLTPPTGRGLLQEAGVYSSIWSIAVCACLRYFLGLLMLVAAKMTAENIVKTVLRLVGQVAGVTTVCIKRKSEVSSERVHFSSDFVVLQDNGGGVEWTHQSWSQNRPVNLDIPVKLLSYICMGFVAIVICPLFYSWAGI